MTSTITVSRVILAAETVPFDNPRVFVCPAWVLFIGADVDGNNKCLGHEQQPLSIHCCLIAGVLCSNNNDALMLLLCHSSPLQRYLSVAVTAAVVFNARH